MSRNLIILIIIFAVLIGLAMFVLIPDRGGDAEAEGVGEVDPQVAAQQTAAAVGAGAADAAAGKTTEVRTVENRSVQVVFVADKQFETESERNGFAPRPDDTAGQQPENPQPEATTPPADQPPTLTPVPQAPQQGATGRSGDPIIFTSYTVTGGETMYGLSQRTDFNTSIGLMALYGIDTSDFVQGNVLNIPIVNPNYCSNARAAHLILEGENVFRIADQYGTTQQAIQAANGLAADYRIKTNEVLCIP